MDKFSSKNIYEIREINDIISKYKNQLEHWERFKKCLDCIKTIKKDYVIIDSNYSNNIGNYVAYVDISLYDNNDEKCFTFDFMISYEELNILDYYDITFNNSDEYYENDNETYTDTDIIDINSDDDMDIDLGYWSV